MEAAMLRVGLTPPCRRLILQGGERMFGSAANHYSRGLPARRGGGFPRLPEPASAVGQERRWGSLKHSSLVLTQQSGGQAV